MLLYVKKIFAHFLKQMHRPPRKLKFRNAIILSTKRPVNISRIRDKIAAKLTPLNVEKITALQLAIDYLKQEKKSSDASNFFVAALRALSELDHQKAIEFGGKNVYNLPDSRAVRTLVQINLENKNYETVSNLLELLGPSPWKVRINSSLLKQMSPASKDDFYIDEDKEFGKSILHFQPSDKPPTITLQGRSLNDLKVACILDEFSYSAYRFEANFLQLSVENYADELNEFNPDMLFIESAWRGKDGKWGSKVGHADFEIIELLSWCKDNGVPTVFWNKEDPVHFKSFLNVAKLFDYVFTTDIDCIQRYKQALKHNRVFSLPFAFQPKLHNPIEEFQRIEGVCFAGAYYKRYEQRNKDFENLLNPISKQLNVDIYDRNFLDNNPDYSFPEKYSNLIVGTLGFEDINLAYKGYEIGLNLNTIKDSQTMFARRVFELLASNTIVFSNYSRGIKLLFGDLVFCSDSGDEIWKRYSQLKKNDLALLKLKGLRNVFASHTYKHRFAHIISKITEEKDPFKLEKKVVVVSIVSDKFECDNVINDFISQTYSNKELILLSTRKLEKELPEDTKLFHTVDFDCHFFDEILEDGDFLSVFDSKSIYGQHYLQDLINATNYSERRIISKFIKDIGLTNSSSNPMKPYCYSDKAPPLASLFYKSEIMNKPILPTLQSWSEYPIIDMETFCIDQFEYNNRALVVSEPAGEIGKFEFGIDYNNIKEMSDTILADKKSIEGHYYSSAEIFQQICDNEIDGVQIEFLEGAASIDSNLGQGEFRYLYWSKFMKPEELRPHENIVNLFLDAAPGLRLMLAIIFYDQKRNKIDSHLSLANSNINVEIPDSTFEIRLGLRIYQSGSTRINSLDLFERSLSPNNIITKREVLVVSNNYPSYEEKYRNGFLHSRLMNYKQSGISVDMFVLKSGSQLKFSEYEGIDVITGSKKALATILQKNNHKKIAVHFLDSEMWEPIEANHNNRDILVWVHGSEIQPWHRRIFNYSTEDELEKAKVASQDRMNFWKPILSNPHEKLKLIFVSEYFAQEVMEDYDVTLPKRVYEVIHNPIDTEKFEYLPKPPSQRKKLLSIRPYASRKYANDLTVKALLELSKKSFFEDLDILIIGDGKLFDSTLEPLMHFKNVEIRRGFLSHNEIADLHKDYGIFLTPTRMDSQGVSRDEAMSSGLIAITNRVTAIPEFVDDDSGILVDGEDYIGMADAVERIYSDPDEFERLSINASQRVRSQSDSKIVIKRELEILSVEEME
ncbi:MAG: glycosyltransferase family protein [Candidatus Poseidoniaceae archaeon]